MVVFRYKLWIRLLFLFFLLVFLAVMGWLGSMTVRMTAMFSEPFMMALIIPSVFVSLVLLLGVVLLAYTALFCWTYRLEFGESVLQLHTIYHPFVHQFCCAYEDIVQVKRGMVRGLLEIVPRKGSPLRVGARAFEGGSNRLLDELFERVGAERFEPDLRVSLWKYTRFDRFHVAFLAVILFSQVVNLYLSAGHDFVSTFVAWRSAWGGGLATVEAFALDADSTPWIVAETGLQDDCRVHHITKSGTRTWDLPEDVDQLPGCGFPIGLGRDDAERPVVVYRDHLLHWDGEAWQREAFAPVEDGLRVNSGWVASRGTKLWGAAESADGSTVLFSLDLSSGEWRVVPPPDSAVDDGLAMSYRFHQSVDGSLLVLMTGENQVRFYLFRDSEWLEPGYPILMPSPAGVSNFAADSAGRIWLLLEAGRGKYALGRFDPETIAWDWSELDSGCDVCGKRYFYMDVDALGRVWLRGFDDEGRVLDVFELPSEGSARHVVRYTSDNSNYQSGHSTNFSDVRLGVDGRMWAADNRLVWLDSAARELPSPLPDWTLSLTSIEARFILLLCVSVVMMMYAAVYALAQRARRRDA